MKYYLSLLFSGFSLLLSAQPNCNVYKEDPGCYEACLEAEKAIRHPQGSKESQEHFDNSIELCPSFDYSYQQKAVPYLKRGQFIEWKRLIDKAVELNPTGHLGNRAWCRYQFLRDYNGAIEDIEKLETMASYDIGTGTNGDYHLIITKALCYKALGQKEKAIQIMIDHLEKDDYEAMSYDYLHLGVLYLEMNEPTKAISAFLKQIEINDYLADTYYYLGQAHSILGEESQSQEYFQKALSFYASGRHMMDPYTHHSDRVFKNDIEVKIGKAAIDGIQKK